MILQLIKWSSINQISMIFVAIINVTTIAHLTTHYGLALVGVVSLLSMLTVRHGAGSLLDLGSYDLIVRGVRASVLTSKDYSKELSVINALVKLSLYITAVSIVIFSLMIEETFFFLLFLLTIPVQLYNYLLGAVFEGLHKIVIVRVVEMGYQLSLLIGLLFITELGYSASYLFVVYTLVVFIELILKVSILRFSWKTSAWSWRSAKIQFTIDQYQLFLTNVFSFFLALLPRGFLSTIGPEQVGLYEICSKIPRMIKLAVNALSKSIIPLFTSSNDNGRSEIGSQFVSIFCFVYIIMFVAVVLVQLNADFLLFLLFNISGRGFELSLLCISVLTGFSLSFGGSFIVSSKAKLSFLPLNSGLNLCLVAIGSVAVYSVKPELCIYIGFLSSILLVPWSVKRTLELLSVRETKWLTYLMIITQLSAIWLVTVKY